MALTDKGYENIQEIMTEYAGLYVSRELIDKHYNTLVSAWPSADDEDYLEDFPGKEPWWTFDNECNGGGISDTCQREKLMEQFALILFGMPWPCYGSSQEMKDEFEKRYIEYRLNN